MRGFFFFFFFSCFILFVVLLVNLVDLAKHCDQNVGEKKVVALLFFDV